MENDANEENSFITEVKMCPGIKKRGCGTMVPKNAGYCPECRKTYQRERYQDMKKAYAELQERKVHDGGCAGCGNDYEPRNPKDLESWEIGLCLKCSEYGRQLRYMGTGLIVSLTNHMIRVKDPIQPEQVKPRTFEEMDGLAKQMGF